MRWLALFAFLGLSAQASAVDIDCFATGSTGAAYVIVDAPDLLATPGDSSSKITSVSFGDRACALTLATVNGQQWVFVRGYWIDLNRTLIQGWLPMESIVYRNRMKRHHNVRAQNVDVEIGDYFAHYAVKSGGAFSVKQVVSEHKCRNNEAPNEFGACEDVITVHGYFHGLGQFAIATSKKHGEFDVFKLGNDGKLCPWQYGDLPAACR